MALGFGLVAFRPRRRIGSFTSQVTFEETGVDDLSITRHPVQQGAVITDHAVKEPAQLTIRAGWSQSALETLFGAARSLLAGDVASTFDKLLGNDYVKETYQKLLDLQNSRAPFEVVTGKRSYKNMLIASLAVTTDEKTENVLIVTAQLREIIIVETSTATLPPADQQAEPQKTNPPETAGAKQLAPASTVNQDALNVVTRLKTLQTQAGG